MCIHCNHFLFIVCGRCYQPQSNCKFTRDNEVVVDTNLGQDKALWWPGPCNLLNCQISKDKLFLAPQLGMIKLEFANNIAFLGKYQQKPSLLAILICFIWCYKELESWYWKQPCLSDVQPKGEMGAAARDVLCIIRNVPLISLSAFRLFFVD